MSRPQVVIRHPSSSSRLTFYTMRGWKLQAWRLVTALPGATSNSGGPARYSVCMARSIIGGSKYLFGSSSTYFRWATTGLQLQGINSDSLQRLFKPNRLSSNPYVLLNIGQHFLCHRYSIVEAVLFFSKVSQQLWW
ncbi:hypothetical protein AVEN_161241-1 [Araneus ventricosus]|uniref:Uncharacterized protein n=1 Tax=Araneus ventricosus TaxID=182803 RepID=A0A4Y2NXB1_ARAVE|nr:hypothetical protein AVEN_161241-1 [Araneus ventricosus]